MNPYDRLRIVFSEFDGIADVEIEYAEIDVEEGGVIPTSISLSFHPTTCGFHALEFLVWALGDMRRAGVNVHHYLRSPPPWLNQPGNSLRFLAYLNPRSTEISDSDALAEVEGEVEKMADFLTQVRSEYWSLCFPR